MTIKNSVCNGFSPGIRLKALYLLFTLLTLTFFAKAQVNDAGLWAGITIEKKFTQRLSLSVTEEIRLEDNFYEIGTIFTDAGLTYKFTDNVRLSGNYRFIQRRADEGYYNYRNRYYSDLIIRQKLSKKLLFINRIRVQTQNVFYSGEEDDERNLIREMVTIRLQTEKKYKPYIAGEILYRLSNDILGKGEFDEIRTRAGIDYQFDIKSSVDLFYLIKRELNDRVPETDYIIGVGYKYSF